MVQGTYITKASQIMKVVLPRFAIVNAMPCIKKPHANKVSCYPALATTPWGVSLNNIVAITTKAVSSLSAITTMMCSDN